MSSTAEKTKKGAKKASSSAKVSEKVKSHTAPETPPPAVPVTETTTHAQEAKIHASEAKNAAGESASEATLAAKEMFNQAGEATATATAEAKDKVVDTTHYAGEKVADATAIAKEKLSEAGETVETGVKSAIEFIKKNLPRVEHEELTPEERQSKALLDEAMGRPGEASTLPSEVQVIETNRPVAQSLVAQGAILDEGGAPEPGPMPILASSELLGEDRSAKGLAEVMEEKAGAAKEYVREHVLHRPEHKTTTPTTEDIPFSPKSSAQEIIKDAERRALEATHTAEKHAHSIGETISEYYQKVADPIAGVFHSAEDKATDVLHSVEDKAKWTYDHTKQELLDKTASETHEEMRPKTAYDAELAHGAIPSSTEEVLSAKLGVTSLEEPVDKYQEGPQTPTTTTSGGNSLSSLVDTPEVVKTGVAQQHHSRMYDIAHDLESRKPGSEGEMPS